MSHRGTFKNMVENTTRFLQHRPHEKKQVVLCYTNEIQYSNLGLNVAITQKEPISKLMWVWQLLNRVTTERETDKIPRPVT